MSNRVHCATGELWCQSYTSIEVCAPPHALSLEEDIDVEVEKHHYHIDALLDTKIQTCTCGLLLQKTMWVEDSVLEKVHKTLEDPGKKLDIAAKLSCTER